MIYVISFYKGLSVDNIKRIEFSVTPES